MLCKTKEGWWEGPIVNPIQEGPELQCNSSFAARKPLRRWRSEWEAQKPFAGHRNIDDHIEPGSSWMWKRYIPNIMVIKTATGDRAVVYEEAAAIIHVGNTGFQDVR